MPDRWPAALRRGVVQWHRIDMGIAGANVSGRGTNMRFCYLPE